MHWTQTKMVNNRLELVRRLKIDMAIWRSLSLIPPTMCFTEGKRFTVQQEECQASGTMGLAGVWRLWETKTLRKKTRLMCQIRRDSEIQTIVD